ncbi:hypothetical protein PRNP1_002502 [Phytophthora ramorum]
MASMQLQDIREMGEAMTRARELCLEAQYEKGLALYQTTLRTLSQFIRRMTKMSERQPWLQMQIELENELSLITDYVELTQAFKAPPGAAVARIHPQVPRQEVAASPRWEICAPPDPRRPDPSVEDSNDPDVWAPPSPEKAPNRFRGGGAARAAPSWANDNNSNNNNPRNNRVARKSTGGSAGARGAVPSGRRTPGDDQRRQAPRRGGSKPPTSASPARQSKDGGLKAARKDNERARERGGGGSEKPKYSEKAKEEGWVDLELIEMIERDIVDSAAAISFEQIAGLEHTKQLLQEAVMVKTELLVQINGVSSGDPADPGNRVMVLAATNLPWELDEAMRRRLSKRVYIPLPEPPGRHQLFKLNLEKVDVATDVDFDKLVASTEGYSGDDICGLCDTAKMMPVKRLYTPEVLKELHRKQQEGASDEELQAHEKNALEITWNDFQTALENVSKSVGQDQLERFVKWEEEFGSK